MRLPGEMKHETNTFSPVLTDLARFSRAAGKAATAAPQPLPPTAARAP